MPSTLYFVGGDAAGANDFSVAANWRDNSTDAVAGAKPASDDIVLFDHRMQFACTAGMAQGAVDLQALHFRTGRRFGVGASGVPLVIAVSNITTSSDPHATIAGTQGDVYLAAGTNKIDRVEVFSNGTGAVYLTGGTFTMHYQAGGRCTYGADSTLTSGIIADGVFVQEDSGAGSNTTTLDLVGGRADLARVITNFNGRGGSALMRPTATPSTVVLDGSDVTYQAKSIVNFTAYSGRWDTTSNGNTGISFGTTGGTIYWSTTNQVLLGSADASIDSNVTQFGTPNVL